MPAKGSCTFGRVPVSGFSRIGLPRVFSRRVTARHRRSLQFSEPCCTVWHHMRACRLPRVARLFADIHKMLTGIKCLSKTGSGPDPFRKVGSLPPCRAHPSSREQKNYLVGTFRVPSLSLWPGCLETGSARKTSLAVRLRWQGDSSIGRITIRYTT